MVPRERCSLVVSPRPILDCLSAEIIEEILDLLPPETFDWRGIIPAVITALRSQPNFYHRALLRFLKRGHAYTMSPWNNSSFMDMKKNAILTITKLAINCRP